LLRKGEKISILIPARNEEISIAACVESVLASHGVEIEIIVLDDHSDDRTADVVRELARKDSRVRLESAPPLPEGWCGKQHACYALSRLARNPILTFLDADVRLAPDALARMAAFLDESKGGLVSGFPRQETGTFFEKLVIPLINWLLLCYLPMIGTRKTRLPGFAVGCGQWFMTTREAYDAVGGHAAVKSSLHDGLTLPRAYRRAGFHTDVCDATNLAVCRMYRSARGVWFGLAKNAREGMAATAQIGFWTLVLFCGQVLPFLLLLAIGTRLPALAVGLAMAPRLFAAVRFRSSLLGALLHPIGVAVLLAIQWYAIGRSITGRPVGWKGRANPSAVQQSHPGI
jgi:glycosyltransferase involved in cell wall biosynthesis